MSSGVGSCRMGWIWWISAVRGVARLSASWIDLYAFMGRVGKGKIPFCSFFSYGLRFAPLLLAFGCNASDPVTMLQSGRVVGLGGLEGRWVGLVAPEGAGCGSPTTGLMTIGQGSFGFAPFQNTVVIRGKIGADDRIEGELERPGGDKKILAITLKARLIQDAVGSAGIEGALASGKCRWTVKLTRG